MRVTAWHRTIAVLLAAGLAGCVTVPMPKRNRSAAPLPAELAHHYQYVRQTLEPSVESSRQKPGYTVQRLQLSSKETAGFRPIKIDWYKPDRPGKLPLVIMSPILAGNDLYVREFAAFYAARGLHAAIVYRPKEVFSTERELKDIETHFQESIIELRQAIDWLETQGSVDPKRIGSFAISLGSILTTILAAVEPRLSAYVFGLPAGHIPEIIMSSEDKAIRKRQRAYLEKNQISREEALRQLQQVIVSEPIRFAPSIRRENTLVIVGLFDRVLGFDRSMELWEAMGRPSLVVLPTGHYTAYFATPYLKIVTYSFLRRRLGGPKPVSRFEGDDSILRATTFPATQD